MSGTLGLLLSLAVLVVSGAWAARAYRRDEWRGAPQAGGYQLRWSWPFLKRRRIAIGIPVPTRMSFECRRETPGIRRWKRLGLVDDLQTGDAGFDREVFLVGDDPALRALLRTRPALAAMLHALVSDPPPFYEFHRLVCGGGTLRAHYRTSSDAAGPLAARVVPALEAIRDALPVVADGSRDGDRSRGHAALVVGVATALCVNGGLVLARYLVGDQTLVLDVLPMVELGLATAVVLAMGLGLLAFALLSGTSRLRVVAPRLLLAGGFGTLLSGPGLVHDGNMALDRSPVRLEESRIEIQFSSARGSRRGDPRGERHWAVFPESRTLRQAVQVDWIISRRFESGDRVRLRFRDGAFGFRYIESIDLVEKRAF